MSLLTEWKIESRLVNLLTPALLIVFQEPGPSPVHSLTAWWILGSALHSRDTGGVVVITEHSSTTNREYTMEGTSR